MSYGIRVTLQGNGDLLLQCDNQTRRDLAARLKENWSYAEGDIAEMLRGGYSHKFADGKTFHYELNELTPADIYALTEMPMFADTVRDDDDATRVYGFVWGFPDYQIRDHVTELAHKGRTTLSIVADYGTEGVIFPSRYREKVLAEKLASDAYKHSLDGGPVFEPVKDIHNDDGATIRKLVGFAATPPAPVVADLFT